jgi:biopolymer transport protein ExbB/TolQ
MLKDIEKTEDKINKFFKRFDTVAKLILFVVLIISLFFNVIITFKYTKTTISLSRLETKYNEDIQRAKEQYSLLYAQNTSLNKQVQDLNLELVKTINNTIDLQVMFQQIYDETITLYGIKDELKVGIQKTNNQLKKLQTSIETIIENKQNFLDSTELNILNEKSKF